MTSVGTSFSPVYFGSPLKRWNTSAKVVKRLNTLCDPYIKDAKELTQ